MTLDEDDLIEQVQAGSIEAFEPLMDSYMGKLRAFIAMRAPVPHLIEDIAHETFVYAWKNIDNFKVGTQFGSWLTAIAHHLLRQEVQRFARTSANKEKYLDHLILNLAKESPMTENHSLNVLQGCVARLPENQSKLLELKYKLSLSTKELAEQMNKSEAWIRTTLFRIRANLKSCVESKMKLETP